MLEKYEQSPKVRVLAWLMFGAVYLFALAAFVKAAYPISPSEKIPLKKNKEKYWLQYLFFIFKRPDKADKHMFPFSGRERLNRRAVFTAPVFACRNVGIFVPAYAQSGCNHFIKKGKR